MSKRKYRNFYYTSSDLIHFRALLGCKEITDPVFMKIMMKMINIQQKEFRNVVYRPRHQSNVVLLDNHSFLRLLQIVSVQGVNLIMPFYITPSTRLTKLQTSKKVKTWNARDRPQAVYE